MKVGIEVEVMDVPIDADISDALLEQAVEDLARVAKIDARARLELARRALRHGDVPEDELKRLGVTIRKKG